MEEVKERNDQSSVVVIKLIEHIGFMAISTEWLDLMSIKLARLSLISQRQRKTVTARKLVHW
ncbi:hypothetical protein O9992_31000 [Vibrio lentus]|nr:hypothetical protein [Vibrio lentus]